MSTIRPRCRGGAHGDPPCPELAAYAGTYATSSMPPSLHCERHMKVSLELAERMGVQITYRPLRDGEYTESS